jgi:hypothetical protein
MNMKRILILTLIFFLLSISFALSTTCRIGYCSLNETNIFSVFNESNSHAGINGYYNKFLCCPSTIASPAAIRTTSCNSDESEVLTFYKENNTHVAEKGYAPLKVCVKFSPFLNCVMKSSCTASELCVASLAHSTNSHIGDCNSYPNKICCGALMINVEAGGPYVKTGSLPTILIVGNVSFAGEAAANANITINIYEGATLKATKEFVASSTGKFSTTFTNFDTGIYTVNVSANYSLASATATDTFKVIESLSGCIQKTVSLSGTALDYQTGLPIQSGTVKIYIKENGDEFSASFTNGQWTATFVSCLLPGTRHVATVQITDSATGRTSWSEMQFLAP